MPAWISNYIFYKMWGKITHPSPNFNGVIYNTGCVDPRQKCCYYCNTSWEVLLNFNIDSLSIGYWYQITLPVWRTFASVNLVIIVSDISLSSVRRQATIWTKNACQLDTWKTISVKNGEGGGHFVSLFIVYFWSDMAVTPRTKDPIQSIFSLKFTIYLHSIVNIT